MREGFFHLAHFYYLDAWGGVYALEVVGGDDDGHPVTERWAVP